MNPDRPLFIPVILGTTRVGRMSENVANLVSTELAMRSGVETELIDIARLPFPALGEGEAIKNPIFSERMMRADALVIVTPEYNHSYPGSLKRALDSCLKEYIHKPVGICGVSAGPFGGTRVIESLLPVLRELGLVTIFWDLNFGKVQTLFDASGMLTDAAYARRIDQFLMELIWMARVLRYGREEISIE
jgi:NAD(P)H-dependent FMN reductase